MPCKVRVGGVDETTELADDVKSPAFPGATAYALPSAINSLPEALLHSRIAKNSTLQPPDFERPCVHIISLTVSSMQQSTPADFDMVLRSFSSLRHLPGWPPLLDRQAFHSFLVAASDMAAVSEPEIKRPIKAKALGLAVASAVLSKICLS
eukprot:CAMPEP_0178430774 /NCGR_PEP_ID=MMETSP0689_2-20121128/31494_1 /TAXON_ID=160604 /ORGANISM="Amphidinium massartii, Strain CS-259" /LENGTH=150 /DNA_ID=CAMNT_0020052643 /DNA_START=161 /DNA_END=610 /DNA_ORIENTATION=-